MAAAEFAVRRSRQSFGPLCFLRRIGCFLSTDGFKASSLAFPDNGHLAVCLYGNWSSIQPRQAAVRPHVDELHRIDAVYSCQRAFLARVDHIGIADELREVMK
jgi:hypothetical protein